jgi:hypothetical protein
VAVLGGIGEGHRELIDDGDYGTFEQTVDRLLGKRIRGDQDAAEDLWAALANVDWRGPNGEDVSYSFRAAGDLCAALRKDDGAMTYMRYYCRKPHGVVAGWIDAAMADAGWTWKGDED